MTTPSARERLFLLEAAASAGFLGSLYKSRAFMAGGKRPRNVYIGEVLVGQTGQGGTKRRKLIAGQAPHPPLLAGPAYKPKKRYAKFAPPPRNVRMAKKRGGKRGRSRKRLTSRSRKRRRGLKNRRANRAYVGRDWPPTELTATFEKQFTVPLAAAMSADTECTGAQQMTLLDSLIPSASMIYQQNTVAGTDPAGVEIGTVVIPTMAVPRNWNEISSNYTRVRHVSSTFTVTITLDSSDANVDNRAYDVWSWISSEQDPDNPINDGDVTPADAQYLTGRWRNILNASRRVKRSIIYGTGVGGGSKTFRFKLDHKSDRLKNRIAEHVSVVTNHPNGVTFPMDTTVVAYESATQQFHGVHNKIVLVWCPKDRQAGQIQLLDVKHTQTVRFYDRINTNT